MSDGYPLHDGTHQFQHPDRHLLTYEEFANLKKSPIQHPTLPPEMLAQIREIHEWQRQWLPQSLEQCELDFMRDANPQSEIDLWLRMKECHTRYMAAHPDADAKAVYENVLLASMDAKPKSGDWLFKSVKRFCGDAICKPIVATYKPR